METFSVVFKINPFSKPIREVIQAKHMKDVMQKLQEMHKNVSILSYMQN